MRPSLLVPAFFALLGSASVAQVALAQGTPNGTTTIIVVRHAEKEAVPATDPPLTSAGNARAGALVELAKDAGVNAIVSTEYLRTRSTVAPLAAKLGLTTEIIGARTSARITADSILSKHRGHTVLLVGHSNTVPDLVAAFGAAKPADICDAGYDNAFVVTVPASGPASVLRLHFGAPASCDTK